MNLENNFSYLDIEISQDGDSLTIENSGLKRVLDLTDAIPRTTSLYCKVNGKELASTEKNDVDFSFIGFNMPKGSATVDFQLRNVDVTQIESSIFESDHVEVTLLIVENVQQLIFKRTYFIYPNLPVISSRTTIESSTSPRVYWNKRGEFNYNCETEFLESRADGFRLADSFHPEKVVKFVARTDLTDEQVINRPVSGEQENGNLLFCSDTDGDGLFVLQEAPPSEERRDYETYDFRISGQNVYSCGWGIEPSEVGIDELRGYRHVVGVYTEDGTGGTSNIKRYLKARFPVDVKNHCTVMVNPWGCGQFPKLVNEQFLKDEFKAAASLNATHYQIDDCWQKGQALGELSLNNRVGDKEFWKINKNLLPNGFAPLMKTAKEVGIKPELWIAPSANQHYRDWKEFAEIIYEYHVKYDFRIFKIDFIQTRTKAAEDNLEKMLRYLREKSEGKIYFNLDTTNGQRPGYFLFLEYGNIFLENRYVCHKWGVGYHPEHTLNNLWNLATFMRPQSLQIEIPDPGIINYEFYNDKGISPPDVYDPEYWAGIAMFANPLPWLAPSRLAPEHMEAYSEVISLHRKYAGEIFAGEIYPIGSEPDGSRITGLQSHNDETGEGLFIVYRELDAPESAELELKLLDGNGDYLIHEIRYNGEEKVQSLRGNKFALNLERKGSWRLFRYTLNT